MIEEKIARIPESGCWIWEKHLNHKGYGQLWNGKTMGLAHRMVYEIYKGKILKGLQIDHLCRVRCCVNPDHLEPVTNKLNHERGFRRNKIFCPKGHLYSGNNLYITPSGHRKCKLCQSIRRKRKTPVKERGVAYIWHTSCQPTLNRGRPHVLPNLT